MDISSELASLASTLTLSGSTLEDGGKIQMSSSLGNFTGHDEFWFPDGNLILVAEGVGFRVYRGLLSEQSTVFADMFASSSKNDEETFEGCPVVQLSDSPQELAHLFRILLPKSRRRLYPSKGETKHTFDEVCALARLSHKYHIQDVEEQALALLRQPYTDSFDQWLRGSAIVSNSPVHAIGAVNIARLTDTPSLLPLAFYRCCSLGPKLLDGWKREDGHVEHLAVDDLKICFAAHERLCKEGAQIFFKIFRDQPSEECPHADKCRAGLKELVQSITKSTLLLAIECSVLSSWRSIITKVAPDHDICDACSKELHKRDERARKEVWDKLADLFGVRIPTRH